MGIYFREIEEAGNLPSPDTGGLIFVSNHVNALVDPILVLTTAPCLISPVAKSTLWKIPGLRWLLDAANSVPIVRRRDDPSKAAGANEEVFDRIAAWLQGGGNILVFPEGTSHNEPHLLEVKSGAARMLARAWSRGARDVGFQSVALEFDARDSFRSRCLLLYGPVRLVADFGLEGEPLVAAMTARLREDLSELLVEGATWDERLLIARVAEMVTHDLGERSLKRWNTIGRQVEAARKALAGVDETTVDKIRSAVERYYTLLGQQGMEDEQLASGADAWSTMGALPPNPGAPGRGRRGAALVAVLPLALAGMVLYWLPYQVPRLVARLAKGSGDEVSTLKLGAGLVIFPVWASILVVCSFMWLPAPLAAAATLAVLTAPFAALGWLDRTPRLRQKLRFSSRRAALDKLRAARADAIALIESTRVRLGM